MQTIESHAVVAVRSLWLLLFFPVLEEKTSVQNLDCCLFTSWLCPTMQDCHSMQNYFNNSTVSAIALEKQVSHEWQAVTCTVTARPVVMALFKAGDASSAAKLALQKLQHIFSTTAIP